jgi:hypothetical protein
MEGALVHYPYLGEVFQTNKYTVVYCISLIYISIIT